MSSYSDDYDLDIRVGHRRSPSVNYVDGIYERQHPQPQHYYPRDRSPGFFEPDRRVIPARSVSRDRRGRRASPQPAPRAPRPPVVIDNRVYHDYSSDDDDRRHLQLAQRRRSRSRSRPPSSHIMTREEFELEHTRRELANLRMSKEMEEREKAAAKDVEEEAELRRAKEELEKIKNRDAREAEERRITKELEFKRLMAEEEEAEEQKRREKEAEDAVERYKQAETERIRKEEEDKERQERAYQRRLRDHLFQSGLDDDAVDAIMEKRKIPEPKEDKPEVKPEVKPAATHTRMARKHLSLETLRTLNVEYTVDDRDPNYVLITRWVPEWEQDAFWKHTKLVREKRSKLILSVEDKKHLRLHRDSEFEWVRKKSPRRRSKSPSLLLYLAGVKPA